ncbi:MAG: beta-lactamase family protein [Verrucomicrobiales bacterium]|nr:beta-lactamase family protein [Verrucomicrobiales bacterium]
MSSDIASTLPKTAAVFEEGRRRGLHLGAQLYVSLGGAEVVRAAFGARRDGEAMTTDTLPLWLSSGKPFTAIAVARLWEHGKVDLDAPVASYLPEFGVLGKSAVTLRHLLTHTGGFRIADELPEGLGWCEMVEAICRTPLDPGWIPGNTAAYQPRASWYVLAEIVQRLDGRAFAHYLREEVLKPLSLSDTWIAIPAEEFRRYGARIGATFSTLRGLPVPHPTWDTEALCGTCRPGGSLRGPAAEVGRFYEALLDGGRGVVRPETVQEFTRPHRVGMFDRTFRHTIDFGLGFLVNSNRHGWDTVPYGYGRHASDRAYGHSGAQSSCAFADPDRGLVVAWACNGLPGEPRHQERQRAIHTALYEDLGLG